MSDPFALVTITADNGFFSEENYRISLVNKGNKFFLRGMIMRRNRLSLEKKTVEDSVKVTPEWAKGILDELRKANIPLLPSGVYGCDGGFSAMTVGDEFGGATYRWWSEPPEGWEILPKMTRKILDEFLKNVPE